MRAGDFKTPADKICFGIWRESGGDGSRKKVSKKSPEHYQRHRSAEEETFRMF